MLLLSFFSCWKQLAYAKRIRTPALLSLKARIQCRTLLKLLDSLHHLVCNSKRNTIQVVRNNRKKGRLLLSSIILCWMAVVEMKRIAFAKISSALNQRIGKIQREVMAQFASIFDVIFRFRVFSHNSSKKNRIRIIIGLMIRQQRSSKAQQFIVRREHGKLLMLKRTEAKIATYAFHRLKEFASIQFRNTHLVFVVRHKSESFYLVQMIKQWHCLCQCLLKLRADGINVPFLRKSVQYYLDGWRRCTSEHLCKALFILRKKNLCCSLNSLDACILKFTLVIQKWRVKTYFVKKLRIQADTQYFCVVLTSLKNSILWWKNIFLKGVQLSRSSVFLQAVTINSVVSHQEIYLKQIFF